MGPDEPRWSDFVEYFTTPDGAEAHERITQWVALAPENAQRFRELRTIWEASPEARRALGPVNSQVAWRELASRMDHPRAAALPIPLSQRSWALRRWQTVSVGLGVALVMWLGLRSNGLRGTARDYVTTSGQRLSVTLVDGTRVTLGPESHLHVPGRYNGTHATRQVTLEGEGYFAVVHDVAHPFAVRTSHALIQDVGTVFDVRSYPDDPSTHVVVAEGKVAVAGMTLGANDIADIDDAGHAIAQRGSDVTGWFAWVQGGLVFKNTPMRDVARTLSRTFGVQITITDSTLNGLAVNGNFTNEDVSVILSEITAVAGAEYERSGQKVVIRRATTRPSRIPPAPQHPVTTVIARTEVE